MRPGSTVAQAGSFRCGPTRWPSSNRPSVTILCRCLRSRTSPDFETAALGPAAMAGVTVERVRVRRGPVDVTLGVDGTSGEVRAISFVGRNGEGEFGHYEIAFSDYRAVGGLRVPHSERAAFDGVSDPALTRTLQTITLDVAARRGVLLTRRRRLGEPTGGGDLAGRRGVFRRQRHGVARVGRSGADPPATSSSHRPAWPRLWPADGPRRLWRRPLGDGFSAIVTDGADALHALS